MILIWASLARPCGHHHSGWVRADPSAHPVHQASSRNSPTVHTLQLPPSQGRKAKVSQKLGPGTLNPQAGAALVGATLQAFMQHFYVYTENCDGSKVQPTA